ncbi:MAG: hypothetical protein R3B40_19650 [Polyangiales bacterium]
MRHPLVLSLLYGGASTFLGACGAGTPPEGTSPSTTTTEPAASTTSRGRYEVHEWGLVDVGRDGVAELAAGPGQANLARPPQPTPGGGTTVRPHPPAATRKPVLYFHLLEGEMQVSVGATMTYGSMLERFPPTPMADANVQWPQVQLVGRGCGATTYPTAGSPGCAGISDDYCEAAELALYEARDASCLVVGGSDYNHLFYRGGGRGLSLPITVGASPGGAVLTNRSTYAIPYALLVERGDAAMARDQRRAAPAVNVRRFGRVPAGSQMDVHESIPVESAVSAVRAELGLLGLTSGETQAFMNAWEEAVFRSPNVARAVVYLLPPELVDAVSTLALSPPPETTRRAMMVRVEF